MKNFTFHQERVFVAIINSENNQGNTKMNNLKIFKSKTELKCKICLKILASEISLNSHMKNKHSNDPRVKIYHCDYCGMKYFLKERLIRHMKLKHQGRKTIKFECDFDGKTFMTRQKFLSHIKSHKSYENCDICGNKVKHLKEHKKFMHSKNDKNFQCHLCNKIFKLNGVLQKHIKTHNKQYQCKICGHKFAVIGKLNQHMKYHDGQFKCKICFKKFTQQGHLRNHMKTHAENRPKPFKCELCEYSTDIKQSLERHLETHDENREKFLKCNQCDYKTDNKYKLKVHFQIHNPNREKFPCLYCNYEAIQRGSLKRHLKTQHDPNRIVLLPLSRKLNQKTWNSTFNTTFESQGCSNSTKVSFIVHGWTEGLYKSLWIPHVVKNMLNHFNGCVIVMDYSIYAAQDYFYYLVANYQIFVKLLVKKLKHVGHPERINMFGFSFGARLCAGAGAQINDTQGPLIPRIDLCDPAGKIFKNYLEKNLKSSIFLGPGFDGSAISIDPKLASKNTACIDTSTSYGTHIYNCHQNFLMGHCGIAQDGALSYPKGSHGLCPYFYNSSFINDFVPVNYYNCQSNPVSAQVNSTLSEGVILGVRNTVFSSGQIFITTAKCYPYVVVNNTINNFPNETSACPNDIYLPVINVFSP
ncbi:hypothetical protein PVAND_017369 [Polypedilum vanderplanki]|uniref:C2H2-type domain-containing protein n=1 Tax=Polypedilum vanderplanki TaxID=319348 RepID=A0A9J6BIE1_POLVA|nr:hypothetical protein PVAND_017369 [Polypedilum vanderplanki]